MDEKPDAASTACSVNGAARTEVIAEGSNAADTARIGRETIASNRPNASAPVHQAARRRPGRPKKIRHPGTPEVQPRVRGRPRKHVDILTPDLPPTNYPPPVAYFAVLRPERTYERRPTATCPVMQSEPPKRVPEPPEDPNGRAAKEAAALRLQPNIVSPAHMLAPVIDFPGPRVPPRAPAAAEVSSTTGLLCSQLDKLQKAAKSGNEGALLLLEQYKAFGKQRHHFSERMLLKCSLWRARSCYSYHCARRTQLFTLPGRTTLHRYGQLGSSS